MGIANWVARLHACTPTTCSGCPPINYCTTAAALVLQDEASALSNGVDPGKAAATGAVGGRLVLESAGGASVSLVVLETVHNVSALLDTLDQR